MMERTAFEADRALIHTLIEKTPVAYIIMDDQYRIHYVNDSFLKLRRLDKEKTIGEICYNISNAGNHCTYCAVEQALETGKPALLQRKDVLPDGSVRYIDDYAVPLFCDAAAGRKYLLEIMVNRTEEYLVRAQYQQDVEEAVRALVGLIEAKDSYTALHSKNVCTYATQIARQLHMTETEIFQISLAALLHDLGKVKIPLQIINKPGRLSDSEFHTIQLHPEYACDMLDGFVHLEDICEMIRHHHERLDGKGYPDGIEKDYLSIGSRILAVADTYDAMTTDRAYRKALPRETAMEELYRVSGSQLDEQIVAAFSKIPAEDFGEGTFHKNPACEQPLLVRNLGGGCFSDKKLSDIKTDQLLTIDTLAETITPEQMQAAVFEHTPCGYVVLDQDNRLCYANPFFQNLAGSLALDQPCTLFMPDKEDEVRQTHTRMRRQTQAGIRTFDVYRIPAAQYQLYAVLDRTEEAEMLRKMDIELDHLLQLLQQLLLAEEEEQGIDFCSPEELSYVKEKVEKIARQRRQDGIRRF